MVYGPSLVQAKYYSYTPNPIPQLQFAIYLWIFTYLREMAHVFAQTMLNIFHNSFCWNWIRACWIGKLFPSLSTPESIIVVTPIKQMMTRKIGRIELRFLRFVYVCVRVRVRGLDLGPLTVCMYVCLSEPNPQHYGLSSQACWNETC